MSVPTPPYGPISYGRQQVTDLDIQAVTDALRADYWTQGPRVAAFERAFAQYTGAKYAVAVSSGTAALHLCALALGVQPGQRVITTPNTFAATANCIRYCGGEVDFADIDPDTWLLDLKAVRRKLEAAPKGQYVGIIPVDFAGYPVKMADWRALADEFGLWLVEDACHAPGGESGQHRAGDGRYADLAIFSFHPVKHIATGEGGMITTRNEALYQRLLRLRSHGITRESSLLERKDEGGWYYEMQELGYNYRLTDLQCALGASQLMRAEAGLARRLQLARQYHALLADIPWLKLPAAAEGVTHAWHLYVVWTQRRKELYDWLRQCGIYAQVHYVPVHLHPYYRAQGWREGDFPVAETYYSGCLSIPMYPTLRDDEQEYVAACIRQFGGS